MALPTPPPFNQPIPNNPFYYPLTNYLQGAYGPLVIGSGLSVNYVSSVLSATGGGGGGGVTSIIPGIGISVTGGGVGDVLVSNTGVVNILPGFGITVTDDGFGNYTVATTGAAGTVTSIAAGPGLQGGVITTSGTISLPNLFSSPVNTAAYPASISVDNFGRVTALTPGNTPITTNLFTGKGQLIAARGLNNVGVLAAGLDGYVLTACPSCIEGMIWAPSSPPSSITVSGTAPITVSGAPTNPIVGISPATTSACGAVQLNNTLTCNSTTLALTAAKGCDLQQQINAFALCSGTVTTVTGSFPVSITNNPATTPNVTVGPATVAFPGVVQLNDTTSSTSITQALTANMGKNLQDQINALVVSGGLIYAGTINASNGLIASLSSSGSAAGFVVGSPLLVPTMATKDYFFIVTTAGTMTPPGGVATPCIRGDWWLNGGTAWNHISVGNLFPYASTSEAGVICLATASEVQLGLDNLKAVTASTLRSNVSNSVALTSSTCIASSAAVKCAYDTALAATPQPASVTVSGTTCYATNAETQIGTIGDKAIVPSGLQSKMSDLCNLTSSICIASSTAVQSVCTIASQRIPCCVFTAQGQLLAGTGLGTFTPVTLGTSGYVLTADPTAPSGLSWCSNALGLSATPTCAGALYGCTLGTPAGKTSLGYCSLNAVTTGVGNAALGTCTGIAVTSGSNNTLLGTESGRALTTGNCNVIIGYQAGCAITTGTCNVLIGTHAGCDLPAGSFNNLRIGGDGALGYWLCGNSSKTIRLGAGLADCAGCVGTTGQILQSVGNAIQWATPSSIVVQVNCGQEVLSNEQISQLSNLFCNLSPGCWQVTAWGSAQSPQNAYGDFWLQSVDSGGYPITTSPPLGYQFPNTPSRQPWSLTWAVCINSSTDTIRMCVTKGTTPSGTMCYLRAASARRMGVF